jgi:hypothetical protein
MTLEAVATEAKARGLGDAEQSIPAATIHRLDDADGVGVVSYASLRVS